MFKAIHAEVDGPGMLQEYGTLNLKEKFSPEGLEQGAIDVKKLMKNQPFISDAPL